MLKKSLVMPFVLFFACCFYSYAANKAPVLKDVSSDLIDELLPSKDSAVSGDEKPDKKEATEGSEPQLKIIKAELGTDKDFKDVTNSINSMVKDGRLNFRLDIAAILSEPSAQKGANKVKKPVKSNKKLILKYEYNGAETSVSFADGSLIQIPEFLPDEHLCIDYPEYREDIACVDFDYYGLPYYTGKVFPEAQNAVYYDKFIQLNDIAVVTGPDIKKDDMRLALLTRKLGKWGVKTEITDKLSNKKTQILLNFPEYGVPPPDKTEGYSISCTEKNGINIIAVNGKDKRGLLWGIVSVLQLTKHENSEAAMRSAEIKDYPVSLLRGVLSSPWDRGYEAMIFSKMNYIIVQEAPFEGGSFRWRRPGPSIMSHTRFADICYGLGLDYYTTLRLSDSMPMFITSDENDFQHLIKVVKKYYASKHINLYWAYDDNRFQSNTPFPSQDKEKFGSAAKTDSYALQRFYPEIKKEYPDFKMVFCPPYYWTTGIYRSLYGESGTEYINSLKAIDPSIGIFWTGTSVASYEYKKNSVDEITKMMGRKPWIFKNRPGQHQAYRSFPTDARDWPAMSYDGFINDVQGIGLNTPGGEMLTLDATFSDYLWNPEKYDATRSSDSAIRMIFGEKLYPLIKSICNNLVLFDVYEQEPGRGAAANAYSAQKLDSLENALSNAKSFYKEALDINRRAVSELTPFSLIIGLSSKCVDKSKDPKFLNAMPAHALKNIAVKEVHYDFKKDIFISVDALKGGFIKCYLPALSGSRFAETIYGAGTKYSALSTNFGCDPFPPSGDYELYISGQFFPATADYNIMIVLNDKIVYEGPSGLGKGDFIIKKFTLPMELLKKNNTLVISNMNNSKEIKPPCIAISYLVIKKL